MGLDVEEIRIRIYKGGEVSYSALTEDDPDSEAPIHTDTARRWVKAGVPVRVMAQEIEMRESPDGEGMEAVPNTEEWHNGVPVFEPEHGASAEGLPEGVDSPEDLSDELRKASADEDDEGGEDDGEED